MMPHSEEVLDKYLRWRQGDPRFMTKRDQRRSTMQRQFTIEIRVDYADNAKNDTMKTAMQAAARHVYATAVLLADGVKPQVAIFSDDFFTGHEEIALLEDTIAKGIEAIDAANDQEQISGELLAAAGNGNPLGSGK
jgi:hypothetical protein